MKHTMILLGFFLGACSTTGAEDASDEVRVLETNLGLIESEGKAFITAKGALGSWRKELKLKPPCYFLRRDEVFQYYVYPSLNVDAVFIIVGDLIDPKRHVEGDVPKRALCGEKSQAVLVKNGVVQVLPDLLEGLAVCKDLGLDEKHFRMIAYDHK